MKKKKFLSTTEVAQMLGISRIAVFKRIKKGEIKARKSGRNYAIEKGDLLTILKDSLGNKEKREIERSVKKTVSEYGETLKLLGKE